MPQFSPMSQRRLATAHPELQRLFNEVIKYWDCTIAFGHRGQADQEVAFNEKRSKHRWPLSKHNRFPSLAVDAYPYSLSQGRMLNGDKPEDKLDIIYFCGFVFGLAAMMKIELRHGGDWNGNRLISDESFKDLPHFELVGVTAGADEPKDD